MGEGREEKGGGGTGYDDDFVSDSPAVEDVLATEGPG